MVAIKKAVVLAAAGISAPFLYNSKTYIPSAISTVKNRLRPIAHQVVDNIVDAVKPRMIQRSLNRGEWMEAFKDLVVSELHRQCMHKVVNCYLDDSITERHTPFSIAKKEVGTFLVDTAVRISKPHNIKKITKEAKEMFSIPLMSYLSEKLAGIYAEDLVELSRSCLHVAVHCPPVRRKPNNLEKIEKG